MKTEEYTENIQYTHARSWTKATKMLSKRQKQFYCILYSLIDFWTNIFL